MNIYHKGKLMKKLFLILLFATSIFAQNGKMMLLFGEESYQPLTIVAATANYVIDNGGGTYFRVAGIAGKPFKVDWGDGTVSLITFTGATTDQRIAKTYASAGTYNVKIYGWDDVTRLQWQGWNAGNFSTNNLPAGLTSLSLYNLGTNITGSLDNLPVGLTSLVLYSPGANITGSLDNLPAGLTVVYLDNLGTNITGSLNNLPVGLTSLSLYNLGTNITGSLDNLPVGLAVLNLQTLGTNITGSLDNLPVGLTSLKLYNLGTNITGSLNNLPAGLNSLILYNLGANITYTSPHVWSSTLDYIRLGYIALDVTEIDNILCDVANSNNLAGVRTLDLTNNTIPSAAGLTCKTTLQTQGWAVLTD
jgi:hypothetical protein